MIKELLTVQRTINKYSCYVKYLISGFCDEFQTNKVHYKRITSILDRLFKKESPNFISFFNRERETTSTQFIHFLSEQGEIIHLGKGYYTLPPERAIQLPDGQSVVVSSLNFDEGNRNFGLGGQLTSEPHSLTLMYSEYIYRPKLDELFNLYTKKLTSNHDIEPKQILFFSEKRSFKTSKLKNIKEGEFYLLFYDRVIGTKMKPEKYFSQWKNGKWHVLQIPNAMYFRIRQALRVRKNLFSTYRLLKIDYSYIEIKLDSILPREENILLRLFSMPNEYKSPTSYYTTCNQLENIRAIFDLYNLKEEGV